MGNLVSMLVDIHVMVFVFMCRHEYDCFMYVHTCTYCICVRYDYVQCCEDTVSVELRSINYYYYY